MKIVKYLWQNNRFLLIGFSIATLVTLAFLTKLTISLVFWSNNRDAAIEPWMPIGYIARSYDVERDWLFSQAGLTKEQYGQRISIEDASTEVGIPYDEMRSRLLAAIETQRAQ